MMKGVNFNFKATNSAGPAMKQFQNGLRGVQSATNAVNVSNKSFMKGMSANRRMIQQVGFQVTDFGVQMAGGQSALLAFIQQGGQVLQFFGAFGAVMAAMLAVFGSMIYIFLKSGQSLATLMPLLGVLPVELQYIADVATAVKDAFKDMVNVIANNLDRILITAGVVAGFFLSRWVFAFAAAQVATLSLAGTIEFLRIALLRFLPTAIFILIGELVYQFVRLIDAAGGFGQALGLLSDVAVEVFQRIVMAIKLIPLAMRAAANMMAAFFISKLNGMLSAFIEFTWAIADGLNALFDTNLSGANAGITQSLAKVQVGFEDAGNAASAAYDTMRDGVSAPLQSVQELIKVLASAKDDTFDVFDLFGNGKKKDKGGGGGGKKPGKTDLEKEADRIKKIFDDMKNSISDSLLGSFKALVKGTKSIGEVALDILNNILDKTIDLLMTPIFNGIAGKITGGIMGGLGRVGASFDGGGYTGDGPRAGGIDGKGGRVAVLHPRETVVDHTKGQTMGGSVVNITVNTPNAESFVKSKRQIALEIQRAINGGGR